MTLGPIGLTIATTFSEHDSYVWANHECLECSTLICRDSLSLELMKDENHCSDKMSLQQIVNATDSTPICLSSEISDGLSFVVKWQDLRY